MKSSIALVLLSAISMRLFAHNVHADRINAGTFFKDINCPSNEATQFVLQQSPWQNGGDYIKSLRPARKLIIYDNKECSGSGYTAQGDKCQQLPSLGYIHCVKVA